MDTNSVNMNFTVGADPEFFIVDSNNNLKSSIPLIEGTKHCQMLVEGGGLQRDNVAAEFSCDPSDNEDAFVNIVGKMISQLANHIKPYRLAVIASANFPESELACDEAREFGCDPDFNGYTMRINRFDMSVALETLRSAGGHIHVGVKGNTPRVLAEDETGHGRVRLVIAMDLLLGIPSLVIDPDPSAATRRSLYGKAGCHRPKAYGVEYRTVGNFWTRCPDMVRMVYRLTKAACLASDSDLDKTLISNLGGGDYKNGLEEIQRIINNSDVEAATKFTESVVVPMMSPDTKALFSKVRQNNADLYKSWGLI